MNHSNPVNAPMCIRTRGAEINVHIHPGVGPAMVLVHGIGSSSADFDPVLAELATFVQPITIDLRGHGASSRPERGYHYEDYVSDLEDVLIALDLPAPIVLGHSLGGIITMFWARQHTAAARAVIIEDSPLRSGADFAAAFDGWLMLNALPQAVARAWYAEKNPLWSAAVLDQRSYDMVHTARAAIEELRDLSLTEVGVDVATDLRTIHAPVLFLHGDASAGSMVHPADLAALAAGVDDVRIERIPGAGHTIHRSHSQAWLEAVCAFVESLPA